MVEVYWASQEVFAFYATLGFSAEPNVHHVPAGPRFIGFWGNRRAHMGRARLPLVDPTMGRAR